MPLDAEECEIPLPASSPKTLAIPAGDGGGPRPFRLVNVSTATPARARRRRTAHRLGARARIRRHGMVAAEKPSRHGRPWHVHPFEQMRAALFASQLAQSVIVRSSAAGHGFIHHRILAGRTSRPSTGSSLIHACCNCARPTPRCLDAQQCFESSARVRSAAKPSVQTLQRAERPSARPRPEQATGDSATRLPEMRIGGPSGQNIT
jgi:hypothetical protein